MTWKGKARDRLVQEGDRAGVGLVVLDRQVHGARAAVDGDVQVALAALAIGGPQLGQVLDVHVHEAELVLLERAALALALLRRRQAAQALGLEDAVDGIAVEMRQEVRDHEGEVVEREAGGAAQGADDGALLLAWPSRAACAAGWNGPGSPAAPRLRHLRMVSVLTPIALGQHAGGLGRAGDLGADSRGGAGLRMDGRASASSCGERLGAAGRRSAKHTPQSPNAPDPNNVPLPNS